MIIRAYTPSDTTALAELCRASVLELGLPAYTPAQVGAWASFAEDQDAFWQLLAKGHTLVAQVEGVHAAFCQLYPADHISLLYTAPRYARQGLATSVYQGIETYARGQGQQVLTTDASKISRPFFEKQGFVVRRVEQTIRRGVAMERYQMEKPLVVAAPPAGIV